MISAGLREHLEVVVFEVPQHLVLALGDDADVDVGAGAQVVIDARLDGRDHELDGVLARHVLLVVRLEDSHGREGARASRVVGVREHVPVRGALDQLRAFTVNATNDKVGADVAPVLEGVGGQSQGCHLDTVLCVGIQSVELKLTLYHL